MYKKAAKIDKKLADNMVRIPVRVFIIPVSFRADNCCVSSVRRTHASSNKKLRVVPRRKEEKSGEGDGLHSYHT